MKVLIFGNNKSRVEALVKESGFEIVEENPELVVSFGGDGTLMKAEYAYPGIPKILLKDSMICKKCSDLSNEEVLKSVIQNKYSTEELMALEVSVDGKTLHAINDITIHNKDPRHAVRYTVTLNNKPLGHTIIGDGIVVATPFGSTAYYRSITDSFFEVGIGLAFNNSTEQSDHIVLKENNIIKIKIVRGPALVYADNQTNELLAETGSEIIVKQSTKKAYIIVPILC